MAKSNDVNSEKYWDKRFSDDWEENQGDKQSIFFAEIAKELFPGWFKDYISKHKSSICDWGCAEGDGTVLLAEQFASSKLTGIDFADTAIEKAKKKHRTADFLAVDLLQERIDERYDIMFSSNVLEHFVDPWDAFRKIARYADRMVVAMVPYNEPPEKRIPEHFVSFTSQNIPLEIDGWNLAYLKVVDVENREGTLWAGNQAMMIYAKQGLIEELGIKVDDITEAWEGKIQSLNDVIVEHEAVQDELRETLKAKEIDLAELRNQLKEDWLLLNSKRYRLANKVAQGIHRLAPEGSKRRKILAVQAKAALSVKRAPQTIAARASDAKASMLKRELLVAARKHKTVIVYEGMPWHNIMRQRPHHIAQELSALGHLMVYIDPEEQGVIKLSDDLIVVGGDWCFEMLAKVKSETRLLYLFPAGYPKSFQQLNKIVSLGFGLIYEYIDELDEAISGDLSKQIEVFERLEELKPVLLLASAKRLYAQLAERFPESMLLLNENAVDEHHFSPTVRQMSDAPADLIDVLANSNPVVGYYGALAPWLDYGLINKMTQDNPDIEFVFIGIDYNGGLKYLELRSNVHYLGPKNYSDLPNYSYWFDCAIIPFRLGEIAKSTSPVKLFEYMAMGLPTVCTRDLRECEGYGGVLMSKDSKDFVVNVRKAIDLKQDKATRQKLMDHAKDNTWKARARDITDKITELKIA